MLLESIELVNFRSFEKASFKVLPDTTIICGKNASGKTSIIEAIAMLIRLESFRSQDVHSTISHGHQSSNIKAKFLRRYQTTSSDQDSRSTPEREVETEYSVRFDRSARRKIYRNSQLITKTKDYLGELSCIVFTPDDLQIIKGGPAYRRLLLDEAMSALTFRWISKKIEFEHALKQRTRLLKNFVGKLTAEDKINLDIWDERFASAGEALALAREEIVNILREEVINAYESLAVNSTIEINYLRSWDGNLFEALLASRDTDIRLGTSSIGPHRDDLSILLNGLPSRTHASQGEQRSLVLALKLGITKLVTQLRKTENLASPILLLDDVFSELDPERIENLLISLPSKQSIITTTAITNGPICTYDVIQLAMPPEIHQ